MATERTSVSYRLESSLVRRMDEHVRAHGGSRTALVERAVRQYLEDSDRRDAQHAFDLAVMAMGASVTQAALEQAMVDHRVESASGGLL